MGLLLAAVDVAGPWRWRWLLRDDETGEPLAEHEVELDPASDEVAAFRDLYGYARWHSAPDRRVTDGTRIVRDAGAWAGRELLGESVGAAIAAAAPVTVLVTAGPPAAAVLLWPLELAHVGGRPLAARGDVTLVYDIAPGTPAGPGVRPDKAPEHKDGAARALRILAVFSQPTRASVLALRRERYALSRLIERIAARERAVVELRVAQYGVTREQLRKIADSGDGWDVLHLSGHGAGGVFLLETADGTADPVSTADLVDLLRPAKRRVRLAVVSACESAADTTAETLRLLGLAAQADAAQAQAGQAEAGQTEAAERVPGLARALARELDCAVVGMRYPVTDEFAIEFGDGLYEHLLGRGHPVDVAVARAVATASGWQTPTGAAPPPGPDASAARPAVSLATPGVFGARAAGLTLTVPRGAPVLNPADIRMAYFPDEPVRFVGRTEAMTRGSAALAPGSGRTAVLLHGMAGAGKTACALELAYRHRDAFAAAAFWQAPSRDDEFGGALASLATALETQLGDYGFTMLGHIGTAARLAAFLPRLRQVMRSSGVLLVLDNLETLLTTEGDWRDPSWGPLLTALTSHDGQSRLILTSRTVPAGLGGTAPVLNLTVHSLPLQEAAALARELPNLRALLHAEAGPVRVPSGADAAARPDREALAAADRERVRRVLRVVQGHPKLLELADAAAADRSRFDAQLAAAEAAADVERLDAFFRDGDSSLEPGQFLDSLRTWTAGALAVLSPAARLMARFLTCLEDSDRRAAIVAANWADLWRRLERPGEPPAPGPLLDALAAAALVQPEGEPADPADGASAPGIYRMHPGVAAAIAADLDPRVRDATDAELARFWRSVFFQVSGQEDMEDSSLIVHAGLSAAPYLLRRGDWDTAGALLHSAVIRDHSPGVIQAALPALRHIADTTGTPAHGGNLGRALITVDRAEAERQMRDAVQRAADDGDFRVASSIAANLTNLLRRTGRLGEALELTERNADYARQAGLGPWTQLGNRGQRLQILALMGDHERVLTEAAGLRDRMRALPASRRDSPDDYEAVDPWNVREGILSVAHFSAHALEEWQQCLDLNAEIQASQRQRGAGMHDITRLRLNDAGPLIMLERLDEALRLLADCQQVFEDFGDTDRLARVFRYRAALEARLGHLEAARDFGRTALRFFYARPEPAEIAASHHNLVGYLAATGSDRADQRAHRLAAALISQLTGAAHDLAGTLGALAEELAEDDEAAGLPDTVARVVEIAERTEGVRLGELLAALEPDPSVVETALAQVLTRARQESGGGGEATARSS